MGVQTRSSWAAGRPTIFHASALERIADSCADETGVGGDVLAAFPHDTVIDLSAVLGPAPAEQKRDDGLSNPTQAYSLADGLVNAGQNAFKNRGNLFQAAAATPWAFTSKGVKPVRAGLVPMVKRY